MEQEKDLTKPFFITYKEGTNTIVERNIPNDTIGDLAFEWDLDGHRRKEWEEYLKDLEEKGIRRQLVYSKWTIPENSAFDVSDQPSLSSYKFVIMDFGKIDLLSLKGKEE